jgi:hypothetical protein
MNKPENSEPESFLARWSARKLADREPSARQDTSTEHQPRDEDGAIENCAVAESPKGSDQGNQPVDPVQLPSLDSIGADTDIADFLRPGVSPDLTRAALRRAWTSDPAIKNFVGLVENGWDFNDPSAMAGFGPISTEEVARLAGKLIGALPAAEPADQAQEALASEHKSQLGSGNVLPEGPLEVAAKTAEAGGAGDDAAQQNETDNKS